MVGGVQLGTSRAGPAVGGREWGAKEDKDQSRVAERGRGRSGVAEDSGLAVGCELCPIFIKTYLQG